MSGPVWTIVVAGGSGQRFGRAKQFEDLGGKRVLDWAVEAAAEATDGVVVVVPAGCEGGLGDGVRVVTGGPSRSESVRRGLAAVPSDAAIVCVHDAARPFATPALFATVVAELERRPSLAGVVPGVPVADTVKVVGAGGVVVATPDRATLVAVQTPQAFRAETLRRAHAAGGEGTDDAALVEAMGGEVAVVPGEHANRKITLPEDLEWARRRTTEVAAQ